MPLAIPHGQEHVSQAKQRRFSQDLGELGLEPFTVAQEQYILSLDATGLLQDMAAGNLTSTLITSVYICRARLQGQKYNATTEECFAEAMHAARVSDKRRAEAAPGTSLRPLEGLPISLKDCFNQKSFDSTVGLIANITKPYEEDGLFVRLLRDAGAIPLVRTNVPLFLLCWETNNNIFGRTTNPWNVERIAGGSSGGESAMIASRGSPLGFGTDIGGSVRIPASFTGICSFKCTTRRLSTQGLAMQEAPGQISTLSMPGPMAKSVRDLVLSLRTLWQGSMWAAEYGDVYCPPVTWQPALYESTNKLRIGVMTHNGMFQPADACVRAVNEAAKVLKASGHTLLRLGHDVAAFPTVEAFPIMFDNGAWMQDAYKFEPEGGFMVPKPRTGFKMPPMPTGEDVMAINHRLQKWQQAFLAAWRGAKLDALLCPAVGIPAPRHGDTQNQILHSVISYTFMFNSLQYPAGVVPVTTVQEHEQTYNAPLQSEEMNEAVRQTMRNSAGLPIGVQVVALPYRDEIALRVMGEIEAEIPAVVRHTSMDNLASKL